MSSKRKLDHRHDQPRKKPNRGFIVGPDNLPDGAYKRNNQRIKKSLIERAELKKNYAKLKRQGLLPDEGERLPVPASAAVDAERELESARNQDQDEIDDDDDDVADADLNQDENTASTPSRHPIAAPSTHPQIPPDQPASPEDQQGEPRARASQTTPRTNHRTRPAPLQNSYEAATARHAVRASALADRQRKRDEREKFRRAMAKARAGGRNGQRKLGRESKVLLERVRGMVGEGG